MQNTRLLSALVLVVLAVLIGRTLLFMRETPTGRALSELYENSLTALDATKSAYSPTLITRPLRFAPAPTPRQAIVGAKQPTPQHPPASKAKSVPAPTAKIDSLLRRGQVQNANTALDTFDTQYNTQDAGEHAIRKWRALARSKPARAAEWRRLGITLALFHHADALEAFAHVADKFPAPISPTQRSGRARPTSRITQSADPFGHGRVSVPPAQELDVWKAIYGAEPVTAAQVPAFHHTLAQLRLGWFENVALAHLYWKAGMRPQALESAESANISSRLVRRLDNLQVNTLLFGAVGMFVWGVSTFGRWTQRKEKQRKASRINRSRLGATRRVQKAADVFSTQANYSDIYAQSAPQNSLPAQPAPSSLSSDAPPSVNHQSPITNPQSTIDTPQALLLAFLMYLVGHATLGLLAAFALRPFTAHLDTMSASSLLRLEFALEFGLYVPIFLLPLLVLRARVPRDVFTEQKPRMRTLLARLGYRTRGLFTDIGSGAMAYVLLAPCMLLAAGISHLLFHRFHTPVNPAQFDTLAARLPLDKILVFLLACVAAPIVEETMFRGLLYTALRSRFGVPGAAMLSAAVFSAVHPTLPGGFLPIWAIGIALALVYERRGSLLSGMILHGIHNGLITLAGFAIFSQ